MILTTILKQFRERKRRGKDEEKVRKRRGNDDAKRKKDVEREKE